MRRRERRDPVFGMRFLGDRMFALIVLILVLGGLATFLSASLGLLARENGSLVDIALSQLALGLLPGLVALIVLRFMPSEWIAKATLPVYIATLLLTAAVFVPGIGHHANGATRWIDLGFTTVQPAEFLKVGVILMLGGYLAYAKNRIASFRAGLIPFMVIVGVPIGLLLLQPNTSTALIIGATASLMYLLAGAPWRDFVILFVIAVAGAGLLVYQRPYLMARVETFIHPSDDAAFTSGYQIQQSLIGIGSGGFLGRGFGQSVEKFNYLPEATNDSVFAVFAEEFGFVGAAALILIFVAFAARGYRIALEARTAAEAYIAIGLTSMIVLSAFLNIAAMLALAPLTGLPLPFVSRGGTALLTSLAAVGIILNIAARRKSTH